MKKAISAKARDELANLNRLLAQKPSLGDRPLMIVRRGADYDFGEERLIIFTENPR